MVRIDESRVRGYVESSGRDVHGILVYRDERPVLEIDFGNHRPDRIHILNSCTKSIVSTLIGIALDEGLIGSIDMPALEFFPEYATKSDDPRRARIRIRDLLTMSSGIHWPQTAEDNASDRMGRTSDWIGFILGQAMATEPGATANYSNGDSHLLSAILQRATGRKTLEFARTRLFEPLGITEVRWDEDPCGVTIGSATLYVSPEDMAKFGRLMLHEGWHGQTQIVSDSWIRTATRKSVEISGRGYGYYWWIYPDRGMFEAWGGAGQRIACIPSTKTVVVMTSDIPDDGPRTEFSDGLYDLILGS